MFDVTLVCHPYLFPCVCADECSGPMNTLRLSLLVVVCVFGLSHAQGEGEGADKIRQLTASLSTARAYIAATSVRLSNGLYRALFAGGVKFGPALSDDVDIVESNDIEGSWHAQHMPYARSTPPMAYTSIEGRAFFAEANRMVCMYVCMLWMRVCIDMQTEHARV